MGTIKNIGSHWANQNELLKIIVVVLITIFLTHYFFTPPTKIVSLSEYQNPATGKFIAPTPCTAEPGPNQCRTYKEEFATQEIIIATVSRKKGSTTCCITTNSNTLGGTSNSGSEMCWTTALNLPSCPSGYTMQ